MDAVINFYLFPEAGASHKARAVSVGFSKHSWEVLGFGHTASHTSSLALGPLPVTPLRIHTVSQSSSSLSGGSSAPQEGLSKLISVPSAPTLPKKQPLHICCFNADTWGLFFLSSPFPKQQRLAAQRIIISSWCVRHSNSLPGSPVLAF